MRSWNGFAASRHWKNVSGFCDVPRITGWSGDSPRARCPSSAPASTRDPSTSSSSSSSFWISCEVRKPSKKCRNGTLARSVAAWATAARSWASWGEPDASMAMPVVRAAMTSEWSPKIDSACVATDRAATWATNGVSSPAILNRLGSMSSRPWDAVKVVVSAPVLSAPCAVPAAPASDCSSTTRGTTPQRVSRPDADQSSACSPIGEAGVIG